MRHRRGRLRGDGYPRMKSLNSSSTVRPRLELPFCSSNSESLCTILRSLEFARRPWKLFGSAQDPAAPRRCAAELSELTHRRIKPSWNGFSATPTKECRALTTQQMYVDPAWALLST